MAIPFLIGAVAAGSGAYGVKKHIDASDNFDRAKDINSEATRIADNATRKAENTKKATNTALENLGETKLTILSGSMQNFIDVYSRIRNIDYSDSVGLNELRNFTPNSSEYDSLRLASYKASDLMGDGMAGLASGTLAAVGAYGAVGALATASTGKAIAGLTGAAATNATLAWLGGGALTAGGFGMAGGAAVLGGVVLGPLLAITGSSRNARAETALNDARSNRDKARKYEQEVRNACSVMDAISERANQINYLLDELNNKFSNSVYDVKNVIEFFGTNWGDYNLVAKKKIGVAAQLAKTIKNVVDTSLLTEDGKLRDYETSEMISKNRAALNRIS